MAKKDFTQIAKAGIDNLISSTENKEDNSSNINHSSKENETQRTSVLMPTALYEEFKIKYLVPQKKNLKQFIVEAMQEKLRNL